ncbi:MAG TPA: M1 family metallopeptidase [Nitrososphaerales archaeon]|nr:M1 family metallopeptidase [Nitrososphaerales archaeon]
MKVNSYELSLDVDFKRALVKGLVKIDLESSSSKVVLDAVDMEINDVRIGSRALGFRLDRKVGALTISGASGHSLVQVGFTKKVADESIIGFYKSRYGSEFMLVTDLEPAEARKVFPCKDDPAYKAVFRLDVTTDRGLAVIGNSEKKSVEATGDGRTRHVFGATPRMSTYLFFVGVGRFEEASKAGPVRVVAAARPGQVEKSGFILDVASRVLRDYSEYFGIPYPLSKLHLIALPEYHTGAMENWGAITSREPYVLVDEDSGIGPRMHAAMVMTHEIAHQWFGDLVTMKWWNDLWLNESFATFMAYKMVDRMKPEWDMWTDFLRTEYFRSMNQDALASTHPIEVDVRTTDEIGQVFDAISYGKGASVIRMIETFVGEKAFRRGVSKYLKTHSYSNAVGADLWKSLEESSGLPVTRLMGEWVQNPGYPLVEVSRRGGSVSFRQRRFGLGAGPKKGSWPIPITFTLDGRRQDLLLEKSTASVRAEKDSVLVVNPMRTGYYSVLYDRTGYESLAADFGSFNQYDKGGLMNDLYLFLQAGKIGPELYYRFVDLCRSVSDHLVVITVTDQLAAINAIAGDRPKVRESARKFLASQMRRVGLRTSKSNEMLNDEREVVATALAMVDDRFAKRLAGKFGRYREVDPELKAAVAVAYARNGGRTGFGPLARMVEAEDSELGRSRIYRGMTAFKEPPLVTETLDLTVSGRVSRSDSAYAVSAASLNPLTRDALWDWVGKSYQTLWEMYGGSQSVFTLLDVALSRCGVGREQEVERFLAEKMKAHGGITFARTLEKLRINSGLRKRLSAY